jgi:hypothetical protein
VRRVVPLALAASIVLAACEPAEEAPTPAPAVTSSTPPSSGTTTPTTIGPDPLVTWSPQPKAVGERGEGWLRETLLVTAPGGVLLHVTPVSSSLTLEYVDATRSLGVWIEIENAGDVDWSGVFGADATLTDEIGNTFLPVAEPTPADQHPDPARYGYANRNLMQPLDLPSGERTQGVLVFRPTLGNRPASLNVTLDGERTTSWVVNIGQL